MAHTCDIFSFAERAKRLMVGCGIHTAITSIWPAVGGADHHPNLPTSGRDAWRRWISLIQTQLRPTITVDYHHILPSIVPRTTFLSVSSQQSPLHTGMGCLQRRGRQGLRARQYLHVTWQQQPTKNGNSLWRSHRHDRHPPPLAASGLAASRLAASGLAASGLFHPFDVCESKSIRRAESAQLRRLVKGFDREREGGDYGGWCHFGGGRRRWFGEGIQSIVASGCPENRHKTQQWTYQHKTQ